MKKIGLRELKRNGVQYFKKELPFIVTRGATPYAIVLPYDPVYEELLTEGNPLTYAGLSRSTYAPKPQDDVSIEPMYKGSDISTAGYKNTKPSFWQRIQNFLNKEL